MHRKTRHLAHGFLAAAVIGSAPAAATIAAPPTAMANEFEVHACDATNASSANNSFAASADAGMTAYSDCPAGQGMTVRNVYDGGQAGAFQGAYLVFDAPSGATVDSMAFDAGVQRHNCSYNAALVRSNGDLGGSIAWGLTAGQDCDSWQTPGVSAFFPYRWDVPIGASRVRLEVRCAAATCPRDGVTALRLRNVLVRVGDNSAPTLSNGRGALWTSSGWLAGNQAVGFDAGDGSGIRDMTVSIDGNEAAHRTNACDYTQRAPCPQGSTDANLPTAGLTDGSHAVTISATDTAGNTSMLSRTVAVDNTPPDAPTDLTVDGGDGWRKSNGFDVHWTDPVPGKGSRVAGVSWELCPVTSGSACVRGTRSGTDIASLSGLPVPDAGAWTLKVWLRDEAGNEDMRLSAPPVTLRYDQTSPDVAIEPLSAADPTLIPVAATDKGSGIAAGHIEIQRTGTSAWLPVATTVAGSGLEGRLDDSHLADGVYAVRATAADAAGNESVTQSFADGATAEIRLPLRLKTKLSAGIVEGHRSRVRLATAAYARYGQLVRVRGRLRSPEGNPLQSATIQAFSQVRDGRSPARLIATTKTSRSGRFSFLVRRGPSRTLRVVYPGAAQIRNATKEIVLNVRAATTIRPNHHRLVDGETVRFAGRIVTGRIPIKGKLVELKVLIRGRWRTFATTRANRHGRWRYDYRFDGTIGSQQYRFRAGIPNETGYPFAAGGSRVVRVRVVGTS